MFSKQSKKMLEQKSAGLLFRIHQLKLAVEESQDMVRLAIRVEGYGSPIHKWHVAILARHTKQLDKCNNALAANNKALILSR